ncbi:hypothetical protein KKG61_05350 [bacterium]|nr:hypothetical protein [bacterium]MBU1599513.1 hypothetical protein [bacterium]
MNTLEPKLEIELPKQYLRGIGKTGGFSSILNSILVPKERENNCPTCREMAYTCSDGRRFSVSQKESFSFVMEHEIHHLTSKRAIYGERVVGQKVKLQEAVCPACNEVYISGGRATTYTASNPKIIPPSDLKSFGIGRKIDASA